MENYQLIQIEDVNMNRLTEQHYGISVIRNKELLSEAMKKLATYEDMEEQMLCD